MFRYYAPNPQLDYSSSSSFGSTSIGKLVLPAQWREPSSLSAESLTHFAESNHLAVRGGFVGTHDGAILDSIELKPLSEINKPESEQYYIVKYNGNGMQYQDALNNFAYDANRLNVSVVGFNYRGVGHSSKRPARFNELVIDGIAQVQRLLDRGVDSKNITLDGLSLGGGVATLVAAYFHKIDQPVYLWNDRSFASISRAAAGMVAPEASSIFGQSSLDVLAISSWILANPLQWDENISKAYNGIPTEYKGHMYIAKKSTKSFGDGVIARAASLHQGVKQHEKKQGIATGYRFYSVFANGHNMRRTDLQHAENQSQSGQDVFESFVRSHRG